MPTSLALGSLSGTMLGATSIGGPPVILYLLAGPDPAPTTRANLTLFVAVNSAVGLLSLALRGAVNDRVLLAVAVMAPAFTAGVLLGSRWFTRLSESGFRRFTVALMAVVSAVVLLV